MQVAHEPVLQEAVIEALCRAEVGTYVDATFGRGGHARAMLGRLDPQARLLVMDRDPSAIVAADALARSDERIIVRRARFSELEHVVASAGLHDVIGVLMDLGVSSPQLDTPERGFSFRVDAPLDMRMDPSASPSAAEWIAQASPAQMERVFREYGEERFARAIARAIAERRVVAPIRRTLELVELIEANQPRPDPHKHAATRVFQAIRIEVNQELEELRQGLAGALAVLAPGGRIAVITFHSLEDRIVKQTFRTWAQGPQLPRRLPVTGVAKGSVKIIGKPKRATPAEIARNPRARSALLRVVEKVP
jgi:16S rRNA (cytosine1402-N4)-methyltransferase